MGRFTSLVFGLCMTVCLAESERAEAEIVFTAGHFYGANDISNRRAIFEYDSWGAPIGSMTLPASFNELRGLAFGPDNLLYTVSPDPNFGLGFSVNAIDSNGAVHATYHYTNNYLNGNVALGKITFDAAGHFYVGGLAGLVRFDAGNTSSGTLIHVAPNDGTFDVKVLPNGDILAADVYTLDQLTPSGGFVRRYDPGSAHRLYALWGVEYEPASNSIFVTQLGETSNPHNFMKLDGTTGAFISGTYFDYGNDMVLASDGRLVVSCWTERPGIFSQAPAQTGSFGGGSIHPMFITQYVPEPSAAAIGVALLLFTKRRRALGRSEPRL